MSQPQGGPPTETQPPRQPPPDQPANSRGITVLTYPLGTLGALAGAGLGAMIFKLGWQSGFYAEPAVGLLAGLGAGLLARRGGWPMGIIAGVVTLAVGVWAEWRFIGAMKADDSLGYFVTHLTELVPFKLLIHAVGVAAAVWFGARK